eukprot:3683976-Amphidinium_carterae.1
MTSRKPQSLQTASRGVSADQFGFLANYFKTVFPDCHMFKSNLQQTSTHNIQTNRGSGQPLEVFFAPACVRATACRLESKCFPL